MVITVMSAILTHLKLKITQGCMGIIKLTKSCTRLNFLNLENINTNKNFTNNMYIYHCYPQQKIIANVILILKRGFEFRKPADPQ